MFPNLNAYINQFLRRSSFRDGADEDQDQERGSSPIYSLLQRKLGVLFPFVTFFSVLILLVFVGSLPSYSSLFSSNANAAATPPSQTIPVEVATSSSPSDSSAVGSLFHILGFALLMTSLLMTIRSCVTATISRRYNNSIDESQMAQIVFSQFRNLRSNPDALLNLRNRLRLSMLNRDFTGEDYEMLQQLDSPLQNSHRGVEQSIIDRLPVHRIDALEARPEFTSNTRNENSSETTVDNQEDDASLGVCPICLEPYEEGDEVRTVVCMHNFHMRCIDPWLRQNRLCPVCKCVAVDSQLLV